MYYTQEQIDHANQADLVSFLQSQGEQLTRAGNEYRWKRHDSLTVRGNKWYRHSQSKGGAPIDFVKMCRAFSLPPGIFTRKPPTITPYSSAEMKAAYRDTPISAAQPGTSGLM